MSPVPVLVLFSRSRLPAVCARRRQVARALYCRYGWSQQQIGQMFGRDRSTVARWLWHEGWGAVYPMDNWA